MVIRKNFKIISEDGSQQVNNASQQSKTLNKQQELNSQAEILLSKQEKDKVQECLSTFFSSVKVLLKEGAVIVGEDEAQTLEEEFLQNPYRQNNTNSLYALVLKILPKEKAEEFKKQIQGIKMSENYDFEFQMENNSKLKTFLEEAISKELKSYIKDLPAIMEERHEKLKLLLEVRPDIKKYLENTKK